VTPRDCLLVAALRAPDTVTVLDAAGWDLLVRQARRAELLASLRARLDAAGVLRAVPADARVHLESGWLAAQNQVRDVRYEVRCIAQTLARTGVRLILLKGAAYVLADLDVGQSRIFGDIDVLVPRDAIAAVEKALKADLWMPSGGDAYDEYYYRTWMHQIPPMVNAGRESIIDVHHTIVPESARFDVQAQALFACARPVPGFDNVAVLAPEHLVAHSAAHLFNEGEFEHGLRDLVDLDGLLRDFGRDPDFWPKLLAAAQTLDLTRAVYYALRYTRRLLDTPIPEEVVAAAHAWRPRGMLAPLMDALFARVLVPQHASCAAPGTAAAAFALYVRSHYLRMPFRLLAPHLARKAWRRLFPSE